AHAAAEIVVDADTGLVREQRVDAAFEGEQAERLAGLGRVVVAVVAVEGQCRGRDVLAGQRRQVEGHPVAVRGAGDLVPADIDVGDAGREVGGTVVRLGIPAVVEALDDVRGGVRRRGSKQYRAAQRCGNPGNTHDSFSISM